MFRPFSLFIGLRNIRAKNKNAFISFISLIAMLGLVLGVAVLITVLSVMNGFEQQIKVKILGIVPQAVVLSPKSMTDWQTLAQEIQKNDSNVINVAPFNRVQGMISSSKGEISSLLLNGVIPEYEKSVSIVDDQMLEGNFDSLTNSSNHIVIGKSLAEKIGVKLGDNVSIILPEGSHSSVGLIPRYHQLKITGIYRLTPDAEKLMAYIPMETTNKLVNQPEGAQGIRMQLKNVFLATQSANKAASLRQGFSAQDWTMTNGKMFSVIRMQKAMIALILVLIILVAGFNLVSSLIMVVTEKKAEIAILKTFGTSASNIIKIFMIQGSLIACIGILGGAALGITMALSVGAISDWVNTTFNLNLFATYYVTELPSEIRWLEIVAVMVGSFLIAVISSIYPAYRAAKITPIQGLSND